MPCHTPRLPSASAARVRDPPPVPRHRAPPHVGRLQHDANPEATVTTPAIAPADLEVLCSALLRQLPLGPGDPAHLVHVVLPEGGPAHRPLGPDDEVDLGIARLAPGAHPLEALVGAEAPPEWAALGVVAVGTVRQSALPDLVDTRVRSAHIVERGGAWAAAFTPTSGGPGESCSRPSGRRRPHGPDRRRAAVGAGPAHPAARRDDARALHPAVARPPRRRSGDAPARRPAALHRGVGDLPPPGRRSPRPRRRTHELDDRRLVHEARRLSAWRDWPELRRMCADGTWEHPELTDHDAAWLDDGAFARWAIAAWPDLGCLAEVVAALLPPRTAPPGAGRAPRLGPARRRRPGRS